MVAYVALIIIGLGAGLLAGLLGLSGGIISVPCLFMLFSWMGLPSSDVMQLAIGTSLAAMVFNALSSTYSHYRQGGVNWTLVKRITPGLTLGCIVGAYLGHILPTTALAVIFGIFAMALSLYFFRYRELHHAPPLALPGQPLLTGSGFFVGALSNILGIGGGTMTVPLFVAFKEPLKVSVATSAATGFVITFVGAVSYLIFGLHETVYPMTFGYIYLPAFGVLAITTTIAAPYGARLSHQMETKRLKHYFAISLFVVGIIMLLF